MPTPEVRHALGALQRLRHSKLRELQAVEQAIRHLADVMPMDRSDETESLEYRNVSIVEAARHWVEHVGAPQSTREIAEALMARGITTRSRNFVSTVYATLTHAGQFTRTSDGRWTLRAAE